MKKLLTGISMVLLLAACGGSSGGDSGGTDTTPDTSTGIEPTVASLELTASKFSVQTNGTDETTITVLATDSNNGALAGAEISLSAEAGKLGQSLVTTDETGEASFTFSAGAEKANQTITITASSDGVQATLPIAIVGTTLSLNANKTSVSAGGSDTVTLTGQALDAAGNPLLAKELTLTSTLGNTLEGTDGTSGSSITLSTDASGTVTAVYSASATGEDTITLEGLGDSKAETILVSNASFGFTAPADGTSIGLGESVDLVVTWTTDTGDPMADETLNFTASQRGLQADSVVTDANGQATVTYQAGQTPGPVTVDVSAQSTGQSDQLALTVVSTTPAEIFLQASPTVIGPSQGGVTSTANIVATVRDAQNNAVAGQTVNFALLDGPGGGEFISPISVETDIAGQASTTFTAGGATSAQDGVIIEASITTASGGTLRKETTLTIGGQTASITFGTTNTISTVSSGGLEVAYALPVVLLVTDNNGNPIAGQNINLGITPTIFRTGYRTEPDSKSDFVVTGEFANEDQNANKILDPNEDGAIGEVYTFIDSDGDDIFETIVSDPAYYLDVDTFHIPASPTLPLPPLGNDYPGLNGILDPGNVASIPDTITTDENGLAAFEIVYPKSYGSWIDVRLNATTQVSGSETRVKLPLTLAVEDGDTPYLDSPFGTGL